jgi:hypothetical protein
MRSRNRATSVFVVLQLVGIALSWLWQHVSAEAGMVLWWAALILLIPGNFLASWIVEKSLWHSVFSLTSMWVLSAILLFVFNVLLWFILMRVFGYIRDRLSEGAPSV